MYDPFFAIYPPATSQAPDTYWAATAEPEPEMNGVYSGHTDCDVAIIGAGYTGLSCALHLGQDHGIKAVVLDAGTTAWGCSGRNGSFARISGGRLSLKKAANKYGFMMAKNLFSEIGEGLETVKQIIKNNHIQCDPQPDGVLKVAHHPRHMTELKNERDFFNSQLNYNVKYLTQEELFERGFGGAEAHAGLLYPDGFAMHPLKLAHGYAKAAKEKGADIFTGSPVISSSQDHHGHKLILPNGTLRAKRLVLATNGYGAEKVFPFLKSKLMPVLSMILVTAPLSVEQEKLCEFRTTDCVLDTRNLLHYYRRLPDGRLLFGGRGPINGADISEPQYKENLLFALKQKFPALHNISIDYSWAGWVAITKDHVPHVHVTQTKNPIYFAGGYSGSGVSFATLAGRRIAELIAHPSKQYFIPELAKSPPHFPLPFMRRPAQHLLYKYWRHLDERS